MLGIGEMEEALNLIEIADETLKAMSENKYEYGKIESSRQRGYLKGLRDMFELLNK